MAVSTLRKLSIENLESRLNLSTVPLSDNPLTRQLAASDAFGLARTRANYVSLVTNNNTNSLSDQAAVGRPREGRRGIALVAATKLTATNITSNSISLTWNDNSTNESGYYVMRSTDGTNYTTVATLGSGATSYTDTGLAGGTKYYYIISVFSGSAHVNSSALPVTTQAAVAPNAPSNLAFSNISSSSLTLTWSDNSNNESGFRIYRSTDNNTFTLIATLAPGATSYNDSGLSAITTYYYKVGAYNPAGQNSSNATSVTTQNIALPNAPDSLTFSNVTSNSLSLSWTDNSNNESGVRVYRSTDGVNFTLVATLAANTTTFNDTNLSATTTYYYQVGSYNAGGEADSVAASATTQNIATPNTPTNLAFSNVTSNSLTLSWADNSTNENGVRVYRSTDGVNFTPIATLAANTTTFNDTNLSAGTTYYYQVGAYNAGGETDSTAASATTLANLLPPVTISTKNMTSFTELDIDGTSANDSILVTQSNGTLVITANGVTTDVANTFGDIVIHGYNGNDSITVDSSVNIATLIYGGDGNDTIVNKTTGKATIVTIGNGTNTVTGNGINTSYWVNPNDTVNASSIEIANGAVNRVTNWYQPSNGSVPRGLYGQNLVDPKDSGTTYQLTNNSFWGTGPTMSDINQGQLADCYYLAPLASLANNETVKFMNTGVDLGDGTYAVRFIRNGVTSFVRVDGDLSTAGYAHPGASGDMWGAIYEKAYAFFRSNSATYSSLNYGYQAAAFSDLGFSNAGVSPGAGDATILADINNAINTGHALAASSNPSIGGGAPIIASHCYSVIGAYRDANGVVQVELRNPWGFDGAGNDGNPNDGLVTIPYTQFAANFNALTWTTA